MGRMWLTGLTFVSLAALAATAPASAQQTDNAAARQACMGDYRRLCAGVRPGEGRPVACLEQHARELSPGCWQEIQAARAQKRLH